MPREFDAAYWESHYQRHEHERGADGAEQGEHGSHGPSPQLVSVVEDLTAGRVLDAGCGEGEDTAWLAAQGWRVTAVDVAPTALRRARERVEALGGDLCDRVEWVQADLSTWVPERAGFDLVSAQYVHVPEGHRSTVFGALAAAVAPGGVLLVVDHDPHEDDHGQLEHGHGPPDHAHGHGDDDSERPHPRLSLTATDLVETLDRASWEIHIEVAPDVVLRARRLSGSA